MRKSRTVRLGQYYSMLYLVQNYSIIYLVQNYSITVFHTLQRLLLFYMNRKILIFIDIDIYGRTDVAACSQRVETIGHFEIEMFICIT